VRVGVALALVAGKKGKVLRCRRFCAQSPNCAPDCYDFGVAKEVKPWHRNYYKVFGQCLSLSKVSEIWSSARTCALGAAGFS
jgi:hypothetical protein